MLKNFLKIATVLSSALFFASCSNGVLPVNPQSSEKTAAVPSTGEFESPILATMPIMNNAFKMFVFTLHQNNKIYLKAQDNIGYLNATWPDTHIDMGAPSGVTFAPVIAAEVNSTGKVWLFALANSGDYRIYYRHQTTAGSSTTFTSWTRLNIAGGFGDLQVTTLPNGNIALFTRNSNNKLLGIYIPPESQGAPTYQQLASQSVYNFTVAKNANGLLEVFSTLSGLTHITMTSSSPVTWTTWSSIFLPPSVSIDQYANVRCILSPLTNNLQLFVNTSDQKIYDAYKDYPTVGSWNWESNPGMSGVYRRFEVAKRSDNGVDLIYMSPLGSVYSTKYYYQLPGSFTWQKDVAMSHDGNFMALSYLVLPAKYIDTYKMSLFYNTYLGRLLFFQPSNYETSSYNDYNINYNYQTFDNDPNGWHSYCLMLSRQYGDE